MTENEAIKDLDIIRFNPHWDELVKEEYWQELMEMSMNALEEVQQYRAIGTPEECLAAVEKRTVMKPIRMDKCTCPSCGTHNEVWKKRRNTIPSDIVYCWHCGQAVEIFRGDEQ